MGQRGPIPERSDQRVRRNVDEYGPVVKIQVEGDVLIPDLGIPDAHHMVQDFYRSLTESAQARYYEPSDWQYARFTLLWMDRILKEKHPSAVMLQTLNQMLSTLLVTEGDRRRVRIEVERNKAEEAVVDIAELFRQKMMAG